MGVNYSEIIEKMRWAGKFKNDSAMARKLGVTPQSLSNYKKRGEMPTDLVLKFSNLYRLSMDWLVTGDGQVQKPGSTEAEELEGSLAAEDTASYGQNGPFKGKRVDFAVLSPDELIYIGKLLKILRGSNKNNSAATKYIIDAFFGEL